MSAARPWLRSLRRRAATSGAGGDDRPALAGGHLLVGVEGKGGEVATSADGAALGVDGADRLAGVLEDAEATGGGQLLQLRHRRRVAEDVDRQDSPGALAGSGRGGLRVEVERDRVDVAEDRARALVEQAVGRGDEAEGAGQDLVAGAPAQRPHPEVQRRGAAGDRNRVLDPEPLRQLPARSARPSAPARAGPSAAPPAPAPPRGRRCSGCASGICSILLGIELHWNAYSSESTRASQEASMMFSETPIVPHSRSPSAESSRTRVTAPVPCDSSRMRTL